MKHLLTESWPVFCINAIMAGLFLKSGTFLPVVLLLFIILYLSLLIAKKFAFSHLILIILLIGLSFWRGYCFYLEDSALPSEGSYIITAEIREDPSLYGWNIQIPVKIHSIQGFRSRNILAKLRSYIQIPESRAYLLVKKTIKRGDIITLRGDIACRPGGSFIRDAGMKVQKTLYIKPEKIFAVMPSQPGWLSDKLEKSLGTLSLECRSLVMPLVTGRRNYMDCRDRQAIQKSGLFHVFVISGFHIGLIALILFIFFRPFISRKASAPVVMLLLLIYIMEIGFPTAALRAYIMLIVFFTAYILDRKLASIYILLLSVYVILMIFPADLFSISFLMSITAVSGIILSMPLISRICSGIKVLDYILRSWAVSAFALIFIAPVLLGVFGYFSLWGVFVFPFVSIIVLLIILSALMMIFIQPLWIARIMEYLVRLFRIFINEDIMTLFLYDIKPPRFFNATHVFLFYILLAGMLYMLCRDKLILSFIILLISLMLVFAYPRADEPPLIIPPGKNIITGQGVLFYKGELNRNDDMIIKKFLESRGIDQMILVLPVKTRFISKVLSYRKMGADILIYAVDDRTERPGSLYTYTLLRKLGINYKIIDDMDKCVIYDIEKGQTL